MGKKPKAFDKQSVDPLLSVCDWLNVFATANHLSRGANYAGLSWSEKTIYDSSGCSQLFLYFMDFCFSASSSCIKPKIRMCLMFDS